MMRVLEKEVEALDLDLILPGSLVVELKIGGMTEHVSLRNLENYIEVTFFLVVFTYTIEIPLFLFFIKLSVYSILVGGVNKTDACLEISG
jgi:hypothetical protein